MAHLINKIIDSKVFGSGNLDTPFRFEPDKINPEVSKWFKSRNLSFYHDGDQGILYLQFSLVNCPVTEEVSSDGRFGFESVFEDQEFGDLQGLIFMFSVSFNYFLLIYILLSTWLVAVSVKFESSSHFSVGLNSSHLSVGLNSSHFSVGLTGIKYISTMWR